MLDAAQYTPRLKAIYRERIKAALKEEFGYKNDMMIPKLDKIVLNLERLSSVPVEDAGPLLRFAAAIQRQRGDYGNRVLSIRGEDLRSLAIMYDTSVEGLTEQLVRWQVLAPDSLILDSPP